jgi:hypothetical protein
MATKLPGAEQERIEPVFGQWIVRVEPSGNLTSTRNRLYRFINVAVIRGGLKNMIIASRHGNYADFH